MRWVNSFLYGFLIAVCICSGNMNHNLKKKRKNKSNHFYKFCDCVATKKIPSEEKRFSETFQLHNMNKIKMMMIIIIIIITKKNLTQKRLIVIHSAELHFLSFFCHCCFLCISFLLLAGIPTSRCFIPLHNFIIFCVPLRFKDIASLKKNQNKKICT